MNNFIKLGLRLSAGKLIGTSKNLLHPVLNSNLLQPAYARTLWHMCSTSRINDGFLKPKPVSECCTCGCSGLIHTGGENDLVEFLKGEIAHEKQAQKMTSLPSEVEGFRVSADNAELVFEKKNQFESIVIKMNVNHSVDADENATAEGEMKAKPSFEVDIIRNRKTLSFSCSFTQFVDDHAEEGDLFEITEVTYYEGDFNDKTYCVAADILDENLYDLFMVVLSEKGITREFVEKLSNLATSHEHSQYIGLLENVRKFASAN